MTTTPTGKAIGRDLDRLVLDTVASLKRLGTKKIREEMEPRYGVHTTRAFGVSMANLLKLAKRLGPDHDLALALHDTQAPDASFTTFLPLIERGAADERHLVKKSVSWALRAIGRGNSTPRWVGKNALRDLASPAVRRKLA